MKFQPQSLNGTTLAQRTLTLRKAFAGSIHLEALRAEVLRSRAEAFSKEKRHVLVSVLRKQYGELGRHEGIAKQLDALEEYHAVTMTCGHQLILGGGPLYVHSKIREVLALSIQWSTQKNKVVPIFWMATEDHDVEEIRHIVFEGKQYSMPNLFEGRATGSIPAAAALPMIKEMADDWSGHAGVLSMIDTLEKAYGGGGTLSDATRRLMAVWHPDVLCLDAADPALKALASPLWEEEVRSQRLHRAQDPRPWKAKGWTAPVPTQESSLFHLKKGHRTRIDAEEEGFWRAGKERWSTDALCQHIAQHPEQISPNALLRPLYQEHILPNVLYAGGAGEMEYWLQLIPYLHETTLSPVRMHLRTSFEWWPEKSWRNWNKLASYQLSYHASIEEVRNAWIQEEGSLPEGAPASTALRKAVADIYGQQEGLQRSIEAWVKRTEREEDRMKERMRRAILRKQQDRWRAFLAVKSTQFPGSVESGGVGSMQERTWTALDLVFHFGRLPFEEMESGLTEHLDLHQDLGFNWVWMTP